MDKKVIIYYGVLLIAAFWVWNKNNQYAATIKECNDKIIADSQTIVNVGIKADDVWQKSLVSYADAKQAIYELHTMPMPQQDLCGQN